MKKTIYLILVFLGLCHCAYAKDDPPAIRAAVDRHNVTIGDHIIYSIIVTVPKGVEAGFPSFAKDNKIGIFEIKDRGVRAKNGFFGKKTITGWYDLVAYETGKFDIPPVAVKYRAGPDGKQNTAATQAVPITVNSVLPKNTVITDIKDIKGPLSYFEINRLFVSLILLLLAAISLLIYLRRRMRRLPLKLPHETALEELEAIRASLLKTGDVKDFYVRISDCIRHYIERSFAVKASEMTTEEFLNSLRTSPALTMEQKDLLKGFLNACDLVKFAKYSPTAPEIEQVFASAQKFVGQTSPRKEI